MQPNLDKIRYLVGDIELIKKISETPVLPVFSTRMVEFLQDLSLELLRDKSIRQYKDIMGYAYWIRKASLLAHKKYLTRLENKIGRGVSFHIAPSNIPIQFAVSMVPALLAGNACVIRVSNKDFEQVDILCQKINGLLSGPYKDLKRYICIIRYDYDKEITAWLSSFCDIRILWGGDETIARIRKIPLPARSVEITFADRYSFAVINSDALLDADIEEVIEAFWTDTFYIDQNACSSPRLVVWTGAEKVRAREKFWEMLHKKVCKEYNLTAVQAVNKLASFTKASMLKVGLHLLSSDNYIVRVEVDEPPLPDLMAYKNGGGYFFEYCCDNLKTLLPLMDDKACQTVGVYGIDTCVIKNLIFDYGLKGVDRIVSLGKTTAPCLDWDGYELLVEMSRYVEVE